MACRLISLVADGNERVWVNPELITRIIGREMGSTVYFDGVAGVDALDICRGPLNVCERPADIARQVKLLAGFAPDHDSVL
ncbi:MAG: hypothetical protein ACKVVP_05745 [Chloroflexota bacterium]